MVEGGQQDEELDNSVPGCSERPLDQQAWRAAFYACFALHVAGVKCSTERHCKQTWKSNVKQQNAPETVFVITASAWRKHNLLIYRSSHSQGLRHFNL